MIYEINLALLVILKWDRQQRWGFGISRGWEPRVQGLLWSGRVMGPLVPHTPPAEGVAGFPRHLIRHSLLETVLPEWMQGRENY